MDKEYLKYLAEQEDAADPQNEIVIEDIVNRRFAELSEDLDSTIDYLDTCGKDELFFASEVFEELTKHFKSQKLIACIERNITRFDDEQLQKTLCMELDYMKDTFKFVKKVRKEYMARLISEAKSATTKYSKDKNRTERLAELSKDLDSSIEYLDSCGQEAFILACDILPDLAHIFKSPALIECVQRNTSRFSDRKSQKQLADTIAAMKKSI